jgi:hypothetical protein
VSDAELEDILRFGFRPGAGSMETKLFTSSAEDAAFFAQHILFPLDQKPLTIVEVEIPDSLRSRLFHFTTDGKTTIAVEHHLLAEFNAAAGIYLMYFAPLPIP